MADVDVRGGIHRRRRLLPAPPTQQHAERGPRRSCRHGAQRRRPRLSPPLLRARPETGVVVWRPADSACFDLLLAHMPPGAVSVTVLDDIRWFRNVAANPNADVALLAGALARALDALANTSERR